MHRPFQDNLHALWPRSGPNTCLSGADAEESRHVRMACMDRDGE